jgi:hypothetical protein
MLNLTYASTKDDVYIPQGNISQDNDNFKRIIDEAFSVDEDRKKLIEDRFSLKGSGIIHTSFSSDTAKSEDLDSISFGKEINKVLDSKDISEYTDEYISLKRKEYISNLLNSLKDIEANLTDLPLYSMNYKLFLNEVLKIYKFFLKTHQEEIFLSIVNLIEEVFSNNKIDKKIIKTTFSILKPMKDLDNINPLQYDMSVKKFFNAGIDFISIKDTINVE